MDEQNIVEKIINRIYEINEELLACSEALDTMLRISDVSNAYDEYSKLIYDKIKILKL